MASAGDIHSILYRGDPLDAIGKPRYDPTKKVKRYFPGKAPEFAADADDASAPFEVPSDHDISDHEETISDEGGEDEERLALETAPAVEEARPVKRGHRELIVTVESVETADPAVAISSDHVSGISRIPVAPEGESGVESEAARRALLKQRALEAERQASEDQEKSELSGNEVLEDEEEAASSEQTDSVCGSTSDSEDEFGGSRKPVFIPPSQRLSSKERQLEEEELARAEEALRLEVEERKKESKLMLVSALREEEALAERRREAAEKAGEPEDMPDDSEAQDEEGEELEYEAWKLREIKRIKRDLEERRAREIFEQELERRRGMSELEREEDDKRIDSLHPKRREKSKYTFLQKYYHKGAFFQDLEQEGSEPIYLRDTNVPVGDDKVDKKSLPKPMQLRRGQFGKVGQVKHTHLADVDTTDFTSAWAQATRRTMKPVKGANQLDRPSKKKRVV